MKEHLTKEQTDKLFMTITSNGCREMEEDRFHQAVNEAIDISSQLEPLVVQKTVDLDEKIYSSRDVIKIINVEGNRFIYGAKEDHTEHLTRTIFCYMADLFQYGKQ